MSYAEKSVGSDSRMVEQARLSSKARMNSFSPAIVYVVDDDVLIREGLASLLQSVGYRVQCFASADKFIASKRLPLPSCLILDVRLPGKSGMDLQKYLCEQQDSIPIIFLTGYGDILLCVEAMKLGALDFLSKPFHEQTLLDAVRAAVERDKVLMVEQAKSLSFYKLLQTLSPREFEIIMLVVEGQSSRDIASRLSLKLITIKVHRAAGMRKLQCRSLVDLVTMFRSDPALFSRHKIGNICRVDPRTYSRQRTSRGQDTDNYQ